MYRLPEFPDPARKMSVYFLGSYLPRKCGIATFTYDLAHAVENEMGNGSCRIAAMNNRKEGYDYPPEVAFEINQNIIHDYRLAADYVNFSGADVVSLQHEFGIFGGPEGSYIKQFIAYLRKPVVTTFHTVLTDPPAPYLKSLQEVAGLSQAVVVMSRRGRELLQNVYGIPPEKIFFIHHGVPDVPFVDPNFYKDQFHVEGKFVILTFGLLNSNKGIETVIKALPDVIRKHPDVAYMVLGATHPEIKKIHGEEYRLSLQRRVLRLGLEKHVFFHNRFVDFKELCEFIGACDLYVTPYLTRDQITSGTLAYALGMGKAVVSTPYCYAREMLDNGRGVLFDFGDFKELSQIISDLIANEIKRHQMRKKGFELGREMVWPKVARQYMKVFRYAVDNYREQVQVQSFVQLQEPLPEINVDHLSRLTDNTGIIQHSIYGIPDRRHGYSTDDVGRALVVALSAYSQIRDERLLDVANTYISFLRYAQLPNGRFHNFMDYSRQFLDEEGGEDTLGRAIWGLGAAVRSGPTEGFRNLAREMFEKAIEDIGLTYPMARSYTILGLYSFLQRYPGATGIKRLLQEIADELADSYKSIKGEWKWFGGQVGYGPAKICQALLLAYKIIGNEKYKCIALEALDFLAGATFSGECFNFAGNDCWIDDKQNRTPPIEQPIDPGYMVEACLLAHYISEDARYLELARTAFEWFLGRNRLGLPLYDFSTGACYDGLECSGVNLNQGAESTICFLLANLEMQEHQIMRPPVTASSVASTDVTSAANRTYGAAE